MATKYFCDKCDTEAAKAEELYTVPVPDEHTANVQRPKQLCRRCLNRLNDWLKPDPVIRQAS